MPRSTIALAALLLALVAAAAAPGQHRIARTNVVVIMTDDQTVADLRVMRNVRHLLVERGTTFDDNFTSFPLCCPSRSTFLTGQYAHNHRVPGNNLATGSSTSTRRTRCPSGSRLPATTRPSSAST